MIRTVRNSFLALVLATGGAFSAHAQNGEVYRWVDEDGVVHFGDRVPPEHTQRDRDVLNRQGVSVGFEEGEITEEERAEMDAEQNHAAERTRERSERTRRDRVLLDTYLSVEDIENLRDRRLELLESQLNVTQLYLDTLRTRLADLEKNARRYKPYSDDADARPLPENLQGDISRTRESIDLYEQRLETTRQEQDRLRESFAADIERFRELKGG